ncbi:MAG TPA: ATP-binding cassette domain-containing protein, partial [Chitinispirillaceae bacterium]|nr:ATP-binding cassette domain-containing protein [Chitinispirillaceae bacterium]
MERHYNISVSSGGRKLVSVSQYPVHQNEITFLFGESGIGKSVLSKALYGLLDPEGLDIIVNNKTYAQHCNDEWTKTIRANSFFVFQEPSSHLNPLLTIREQLNEGSLRDIDDKEILHYLWQSSGDEAVRRLIDLYPKPYRPSGGEKQRILLAMAFKRINALIDNAPVNEPSFFVFDEPTGSLDNKYRNLFLSLLFAKFAARPFTIQIITHDYSIISEIYRMHHRLMDHVRFKELTRVTSGIVAVNDFTPEDYLKWLETPCNQNADRFTKDTILSVEPHFSIFGKNHTIYQDRQWSNPSPLIIKRGDIAYVKAPSGVGKTTLAKIIMGIYHADSFSMHLSGLHINDMTSPTVWAKKIWGTRAGMVFQHADESLNLQATVKETFDGLPGKRLTDTLLKTKLSELFEGTITDDFLNKKVAYLSGGQKQRLNILRTLVP